LVSGTVKTPDKLGHHDYLAGCALAAFLLQQTSGVSVAAVRDGWPEDDGVFEGVRSLVFYTGGMDKHAFLKSPERIERIQRLIDDEVGIVMLHQAVRYPREFAEQATTWIGGVHVPDKSGRGHWRTQHLTFPAHPVTRGVQPWKIKDGWLNEIQFVDRMRGITPLLWSSREHRGSNEGGTADVVAWTYDRPGGGRSFCFTGLDAHSAWSVPGVRQLIVNGILWSARMSIPTAGAPCAADETVLKSYLTPRGSSGSWTLRHPLRRLRRLAGS
jgi:type 1 glutamine amidotransferase